MSIKNVVGVAKITFEVVLGYRIGLGIAEGVCDVLAAGCNKAIIAIDDFSKKLGIDLKEEYEKLEFEKAQAQAILKGKRIKKVIKNKAPIGFK